MSELPPPEKIWRMTEMLPDELAERLALKPVAVLPFGTLEWHSYHLPIGLDSLKAEAICEKVAKKSGALLAPPTHWAVGGVPYPYTTRFDLDLIEALTRQLFQQLDTIGIRAIFAVTGHFGLEQTLMLKRAALTCMQNSSLTIFAAGEFEVVTDHGYLGDHAAKWETSLLWAIRPDLVRLAQVAPNQTLDGILGQDPRAAASESLGQATLNLIVERFTEMVRRMLTLSPLQRVQYIEALAMCVRVLERLLLERSLKPKSQVPPVVTPAYVQYLQAIMQGDYVAARRFAETKFENLAA